MSPRQLMARDVALWGALLAAGFALLVLWVLRMEDLRRRCDDGQPSACAELAGGGR